MGLVFDATEVASGRRVAVKLLRRRRRAPGDIARLLREARLAQRVRHANIVPVLDVAEDAEIGAPFLVSEFVEGGNLRSLLKERGRLTPEEAISVAVPLCEALAALHDAGVVHRDVKPENVLMARALGPLVPRLTDFGIARELDADASEPALTQDGTALGTPRYMSPEQARGQRDLDEQTDLWALGVVLYELVAGRTPFERDNTHATLAAVLMGPIDRLDEATPGTPAALADVVARALERNRARRFGSARELRDALVGASLAHASTEAVAVPRSARPTRAPKRFARLAAIALGATLVTAVGASMWSHRPRPIAPRPPVVASLPPPQALPVRAPDDAPTPTPIAIAPSRDEGARPVVQPPRRVARVPRVGANGSPIEGL